MSPSSSPPGAALSDGPAVSLEGVVKRFGHNTVLEGVDFELRPGEVHAIAGANGSGKSTLMKIVYGVHHPSEGNLVIRGAPVRLRGPGHALRMGIAAVPQELPLVASLSVAENVWFGHLPRRAGLVDRRQLLRGAASVLEQVDAEGRIHPEQAVGSLDLSAQQLVSIARALARGAGILLLDEPTSSLDAAAAKRLFGVIRRLRSEGRAIAFISQRLDDIFSVADRVSVLRDGSVVGRLAVSGTDEERVAELMAGHSAVPVAASSPRSSGRSVLQVEALSVGRLREISFSLGEGEVLGLAGLPGSGAENVLPAIFGRTRHSNGRLRLAGKDLTKASLRRRVRAGLAYVSGDRRRDGLVGVQTVEFNLTMAFHWRARLVAFSHRRQRRKVLEVIDQLGLQPRDPGALAATLSGGNQQKVVVGRWLLGGARFWLLDDPTRGVDVHARSDIHRLIRERSTQGGGAVMTSSDMRELLEVCDRVLVISRGQVVAELDPAVTSEHRVLALAGGAALGEGPKEPPCPN